MRIAIVANPRSGSTSFTQFIDCNFIVRGVINSVYLEPFNFFARDKAKHKNINFLTSNENVIIKTFTDEGHFPFESFQNMDDYWDWFVEFFDKIIIIERLNKKLQAESLYYHLKLNKKYFGSEWHTQKVYDFEIKDIEQINRIENKLKTQALFYNFFTEKGFPKFYYEDIFLKKSTEEFERLEDYLGIKFDEACIKECIESTDKIVRLEKKIKLI